MMILVLNKRRLQKKKLKERKKKHEDQRSHPTPARNTIKIINFLKNPKMRMVFP